MSAQQSITELLKTYAIALKERNVDNMIKLYTADGAFLAPGNPTRVGTEEIHAAYTRVFASSLLEIEFDIEEIVVMSDEWAFARTTAEGTKTYLSRDYKDRHLNQELFVLQKVEGEWKIARYAFSSMKPLV